MGITQQQASQEWSNIAPEWIQHMRGAAGDPSRDWLLDPWVFDALGDVAGRDVIDLGCGEGRFARMLAQRGAHVTGVDLCEPMIRAAEGSKVANERYLVADMQQLDIPDHSFDLAVSYLSVLDVIDVTAAVREAFRVLRTGGKFVVCNLSPMVTAGNGWVKDSDGKKLHFLLDNYLDRSPREMRMCGGCVSNFHRTLSDYLNGMIAAGFVLEGIREPYPSVEQLKKCPSNDDQLRVPLFIIYLLRKP